MATSFFTNNTETTFNGTVTASQTSIPVVDASVFSSRIQDGAGITDNLRQIGTFSDSSGQIEIVYITNAVTGTNTITVTRAREGTVGLIFADGDSVSIRLTAEELNSCFLNRDYGIRYANIGINAVDLVTERSAAAHVASGNYSVATGRYAGAEGEYGAAYGGLSAATGARSTGAGYSAAAIAADSSAFGSGAKARVAKTNNISGMNIIRKDSGESDEMLAFGGMEAIVFSQEYAFLTAAADDVITIEVPALSTFFVTEVGFIPVAINTVTTPPTIEFGSNTVTDAILTATAITTETVNKRERFSNLINEANWVAGADENGHTTNLTVSVTVAAVATQFTARVYFKGFLLEDR